MLDARSAHPPITNPQITQIDADTSQIDPVLICVICVICGQTSGGRVERISRIENRVSREGG